MNDLLRDVHAILQALGVRVAHSVSSLGRDQFVGLYGNNWDLILRDPADADPHLLLFSFPFPSRRFELSTDPAMLAQEIIKLEAENQ